MSPWVGLWPTSCPGLPWPTPTLAYPDIRWLTPYHGLHICPGLPWPTLVYTIPWHSLACPPHPGIRWPTPTLILAYPGLPHTLVHPDPAWPTLTYPRPWLTLAFAGLPWLTPTLAYPGLPWPTLAYTGPGLPWLGKTESWKTVQLSTTNQGLEERAIGKCATQRKG